MHIYKVYVEKEIVNGVTTCSVTFVGAKSVKAVLEFFKKQRAVYIYRATTLVYNGARAGEIIIQPDSAAAPHILINS